MKSGDQTDILRAGYWSSYNIPFYEDIYNMSGYFTAFEAHGTDFSYGLCPRAKIFRRDQGKVKKGATNLKVEYSLSIYIRIQYMYSRINLTTTHTHRWLIWSP